MENVTPVARSDIASSFLQWSPIVLGALAATALSSVLRIVDIRESYEIRQIGGRNSARTTHTSDPRRIA